MVVQTLIWTSVMNGETEFTSVYEYVWNAYDSVVNRNYKTVEVHARSERSGFISETIDGKTENTQQQMLHSPQQQPLSRK